MQLYEINDKIVALKRLIGETQRRGQKVEDHLIKELSELENARLALGSFTTNEIEETIGGRNRKKTMKNNPNKLRKTRPRKTRPRKTKKTRKTRPGKTRKNRPIKEEKEEKEEKEKE